jgi:hypothetical protein
MPGKRARWPPWARTDARLGLEIAATAGPVLLLLFAWRALSSPGMVTGTSYENWQSAVGVNFWRPLVAAFYVAVYLVFLSFPAMCSDGLGCSR